MVESASRTRRVYRVYVECGFCLDSIGVWLWEARVESNVYMGPCRVGRVTIEQKRRESRSMRLYQRLPTVGAGTSVEPGLSGSCVVVLAGF